MGKTEEKLKKSKIMNAFLLFGILKQNCEEFEKKMAEDLKDFVFRNVEDKHVNYFCSYIIENYEAIDLKYLTHDDPKIMNEK